MAATTLAFLALAPLVQADGAAMEAANAPMTADSVVDAPPEEDLDYREISFLKGLLRRGQNEGVATPLPATENGAQAAPAPAKNGLFGRRRGASTTAPRELRMPEFRLGPHVGATRRPADDDGLMGNRQASLTPFPNLDVQAGPLSVDQLPWRHLPTTIEPHSVYQTVEVDVAFGGWNANGLSNGGLGLRNAVQLGVPFWRERQVGLHLGAAVEPNTFPQVMTDFTLGVFHNALWPEDPAVAQRLRERLSVGVGVDVSYDSEHRVVLGQTRTQVGYSLEPNRECGLWFAIPANDQVAEVGSGGPVLMDIGAQVAFYHRQTYANEMDVTAFIGRSEGPGEVFIGCYLAKRFSQQLFWTLSAMKDFGGEGGYSVFAGVRVAPWPLTEYSMISGNRQHAYRPFQRTVDHITMRYRIRDASGN